MRSMDCFYWTDFLLSPSGCRLFNKSAWQKVVCHVLLIVAAVRIAISFKLEMDAIFETFNTYSLADITYWASCIAFFCNFLIKRRSYRSFITHLVSQLKIDEMKVIETSSKKNLILFLIHYVLILTSLAPFLFRSNWVLRRIFVSIDNQSKVLLVIAILQYLYELMLVCTWMTIGTCLYLITHLMKHQFSVRCLNLVMSRNSDLERFALMSRMTQVGREFTDTFSNIPFFILVANFFEASGYLLVQMQSSLPLLHRCQMMLFSFIFLSNVIIICLTISKRYEELERVRDQVIRAIESKSVKTLNDGLLIQSIQRSVTPETAWKMFEINKSMVASYLGQLLTFSVLFNQMIPSK